MRRDELFWGALLVMAGLVFLLNTTGVLSFNVWGVIWPLALIALGGYIVLGYLAGPQSVEVEEVAIPLEGEGSGRIQISHGGGRLSVAAGTDEGVLVAGRFGGGLGQRVRRRDGTASVELRLPSRVIFPFVPWVWGAGGLNWDVRLNPKVPLDLKLETGAGQNVLDLSDLQVRSLELETGVSRTDLTLPARAGMTRAEIETGIARVTIRVPDGVAARIEVDGGLSSVHVDTTRFPKNGKVYQSPDYAGAVHKVDVEIDTGIGSINIR
jgi:hypothetical protein